MRKILKLLFVATFFTAASPFLLAMGQAPPESQERWAKEDRAAQALEALRRAYEDRDFSGFFHGVSEDYRQGETDLRSDLADERGSISSVDLHFTANQTVVEGDKAAIQVRWKKRTMDAQSGQPALTEGSAEFVFQLTPDGKALLLDIRGQSPF